MRRAYSRAVENGARGVMAVVVLRDGGGGDCCGQVAWISEAPRPRVPHGLSAEPTSRAPTTALTAPPGIFSECHEMSGPVRQVENRAGGE